jgi:hypothetical protein
MIFSIMPREVDMQSISDPTETFDGTFVAAIDIVSVLSKRFEQVAAEIAHMSFEEYQRSAELLDGLMEARTLDRLLEIEADYLKCANRAFTQHAQRLHDLYAAVGRDLAKPITQMDRPAAA